MSIMKKHLPLFAAFLSAVILFSCSTVAVTGRKQLNLISGPQIISLSATQYDEVLKTSKLSTNKAQSEMIRKVGGRIQGAVESYMKSINRSDLLTGFNWEYNLIQDDTTVNAWCMPGGKVAFYSAILPICKDETGIAVVMGHEVAHAVANHGAERMSEQLLAQVGLEAIGTIIGDNPTLTQQTLFQAVGMGTQLGLLKFSRTHESEADRMGLIFMAMAGYDPTQAPEFWKRMAANSGGQQVPQLLSTHPADETRIADLNRWLPEAQKYYKP